MKDYNELLSFAQGLINKGRRPAEIRSAVEYRAANPELARQVLEDVFRVEAKSAAQSRKKYSLEVIRANKHYTNLEWSFKTILRIPVMLLFIGGIVWFLSKPVVNDNQIYGIFTVSSALCIIPLFYLAKRERAVLYLIVALALSTFLYAVELIGWGIPNDFLKGYDQYHMNYRANGYMARMIAGIMPWVYTGLRIAFLLLIARPYLNWRRYHNLPHDLRIQLEEMNQR